MYGEPGPPTPEDRTDRSPGFDVRSTAVAAAVGAAAYAVGYLVVLARVTAAKRLPAPAVRGYDTSAPDPEAYKPIDPPHSLADAPAHPPEGVAAGWVQYVGHGVPLVDATHGPPESEPLQGVTMVAAWEPAVFLVAPTLLALGGAVLARRHGADSLRAGAYRGAAVVVGYVPLVLLGVLWFLDPTPGTSLVPSPVLSLVLAGTLYPLAFGGLGGALAAWLGTDSTADRTPEATAGGD